MRMLRFCFWVCKAVILLCGLGGNFFWPIKTKTGNYTMNEEKVMAEVMEPLGSRARTCGFAYGFAFY